MVALISPCFEEALLDKRAVPQHLFPGDGWDVIGSGDNVVENKQTGGRGVRNQRRWRYTRLP
jgi:hypothetical protein